MPYMKYSVDLPSDLHVSIVVQAESREAAEKYVKDTVKNNCFLIVAADKDGNYIEVGDITFIPEDMEDMLNFLAGEPPKRKDLPGQKIVESHKLIPNNQKSFYGKAIVKTDSLGNQILYSYNTPVIMKEPDGSLHRLWEYWTYTTGKHIGDFCGLNKKAYLKLELERLL